jgi:hypothetical protein
VTVQGLVTLAQKTTVNMSFTGANNAADQLDVLNGELTLNGTLNLNSFDGLKPTASLAFFDDVDANYQPSIIGSFTSIIDNAGGRGDSGTVVEINPIEYQYQVTIS